MEPQEPNSLLIQTQEDAVAQMVLVAETAVLICQKVHMDNMDLLNTL
jgi:hypothetical protein